MNGSRTGSVFSPFEKIMGKGLYIRVVIGKDQSPFTLLF